MLNHNELSKEIYAQNKSVGWWDDPDRCKLTSLQLVSTEIAEATEAERKNLMDDHLPHRKGGEVELADAMIRLLDMGGAYGWEVQPVHVVTASYLQQFDNYGGTIGSKHAILNVGLASLMMDVCLGNNEEQVSYTSLLYGIELISSSQGYDLEGALREKLAYNAKRQDHKREARAAEGGKKF